MQPDQLLQNLDGLIWFFVLLIPFNLVQKNVHVEIQTIFYLLTRKRRISILIFALIFLPGVFLHELSHLIIARLTGVKTGKFSLVPKPTSGGQLQLGFVETGRTDWLRGSLIGAAPLIAGGSLIAYFAAVHLKLPVLWEFLIQGQSSLFWKGLFSLPELDFFWLQFYLIFVVSSTMLPSDSDRHAWMPLGITIAILTIVVIVVGAGPWMIENLVPTIDSIFKGLAMVIGVSGILHLLLFIPAIGIHRLLVRITGYDIR